MPRKNTSRSTLSANTLFYFTNSVDNLISILSNEFEPRYCLDHVCFQSHNAPRCAIPMVCFCDIPLSQIKDHITTYGNYAIGLSKSWGKQHGINPVLYSYSKSPLSNAIAHVGSSLSEDGTPSSLDPHSALSMLIYMTFFTKPYEGPLCREGVDSRKMVRFYNEREWRYVPPLSNLADLGLPLGLRADQFADKELVRQHQQEIASNSRLKFGPNDIKYLIVENEGEILGLMDRIDSIKGGKYPGGSIRKLCSRITSIEHILDDF